MNAYNVKYESMCCYILCQDPSQAREIAQKAWRLKLSASDMVVSIFIGSSSIVYKLEMSAQKLGVLCGYLDFTGIGWLSISTGYHIIQNSQFIEYQTRQHKINQLINNQ